MRGSLGNVVNHDFVLFKIFLQFLFAIEDPSSNFIKIKILMQTSPISQRLPGDTKFLANLYLRNKFLRVQWNLL